MKEQIKQIINLGGYVEFPYKERLNEWMDTINISHSYVLNSAVVCMHGIYKEFPSTEEAIQFFCKKAISKDNYGLVINGIRKHKIADKDLDDYSEEELKEMCDRYVREYFHKDYPNV